MDQGTRHTLTVTSRENAGITVVKMQGSLAATTAEHGNQEMKKIVDAGARKVVVNLADVDYISSTGLRVLLIAARAVEQAGGHMVLCGMPKEIQRLFDIAGFSELFTILPTQDEAIRALR